MRRSSRRLLLVTAVVGAVWAIRSLLLVRSDRRSRRPRPGPWPPLPDPDQSTVTTPPAVTAPSAPAPVSPAAASPPTAGPDDAGRTWLEPTGDGSCPGTHPVKVKLRSKLYHLPGMGAYERTHPDRCYRSDAAAEADGFTRAKR